MGIFLVVKLVLVKSQVYLSPVFGISDDASLFLIRVLGCHLGGLADVRTQL